MEGLNAIFKDLHPFYLSRAMADSLWHMTSWPIKCLNMINRYRYSFMSHICRSNWKIIFAIFFSFSGTVRLISKILINLKQTRFHTHFGWYAERLFSRCSDTAISHWLTHLQATKHTYLQYLQSWWKRERERERERFRKRERGRGGVR